MDISFQQLKYVLELVEHRHFGQAANACHVTQPTLSMQIRKLEDGLGQELFRRDRSPLELTPFGAAILPELYELRDQYHQLDQRVLEAQGAGHGELRIGVIPTIAAYLVPGLFEQQDQLDRRYHWKITELKSEELLEALEKRQLDLGIMAGPVSGGSLHKTPLFNEEILVYAPELKGKRVSLQELQTLQPWLLSKGNCLRTQMIHFCDLQREGEQRWTYEGGNLEMLLRLVDRHGGYTLVPEFYKTEYDLSKKHLKRVYDHSKSVHPARHILALSPSRSGESQAIQDVLSYIKRKYTFSQSGDFELLSWR
ncbi:MAG: LysR family transcriptional regulator [Bacteroidetes bacterium]|nr:MAG: LysR family transcriptional regulator [Bacteroidota bacterium]